MHGRLHVLLPDVLLHLLTKQREAKCKICCGRTGQQGIRSLGSTYLQWSEKHTNMEHALNWITMAAIKWANVKTIIDPFISFHVTTRVARLTPQSASSYGSVRSCAMEHGPSQRCIPSRSWPSALRLRPF